MRSFRDRWFLTYISGCRCVSQDSDRQHRTGRGLTVKGQLNSGEPGFEPDDAKVSRPVPRGRDNRKAVSLPDQQIGAPIRPRDDKVPQARRLLNSAFGGEMVERPTTISASPLLLAELLSRHGVNILDTLFWSGIA